MSNIVSLNNATSKAIVSAQVIPSLWAAVKELIENSLDSGATWIDIALSDFGIGSIEVQDDGRGMSHDVMQSFETLHHTTKIREFDDIQHLSSYGFRGEALASLCHISQEVLIVSRVNESNSKENKVVYRRGEIVSEPIEQHVGSLLHRTHGTCIRVSGLFEVIPVRRKHFIARAKKEFATLVLKIQQYALLVAFHGFPDVADSSCTTPRTRIRCLHDGKIISAPQHTGKPLDIVTSVLGPKVARVMQEIVWPFCVRNVNSPASDKTGNARDLQYNGTTHKRTKTCNDPIADSGVEGVFYGLMGLLQGNSRSSIQYLYLDGRPVEMPLLTKLLNAAVPTESGSLVYVCTLRVRSGTYDVNMSPDKKTVCVQGEDSIVAALQAYLVAFIDTQQSQQHQTNAMHYVSVPSVSPRGIERCENGTSFSESPIAAKRLRDDSEEPKKTTPARGASEESNEATLSPIAQRVISPAFSSFQFRSESSSQRASRAASNVRSLGTQQQQHTSENANTRTGTEPLCKPPVIPCLQGQEESPVAPIELVSTNANDPDRCDEEVVFDDDISPCAWNNCEVMLLNVDVDALFSNPMLMPVLGDQHITKILQHSVVDQEVDRVLRVGDFEDMSVIGQFNNGFIITRMDQEMYVIDQHAADEKRNFELLMSEAREQIAAQKLLIPRVLSPSLAIRRDELEEHKDILRKNGIVVRVNETLRPGDVMHEVHLLAIPSAMGVVYTDEEVEEVIAWICDASSSQRTVPLSGTLRHAMATKACRKSIMIGTVLSERQMKDIVHRLAWLEQPWNCPHGRPTVRRVATLEKMQRLTVGHN